MSTTRGYSCLRKAILVCRVPTSLFPSSLLDDISQMNKNDFGTQKYEHWIVTTQKKYRLLQLADKEKESSICRDIFICTEHLRVSVYLLSFHTEVKPSCSF